MPVNAQEHYTKLQAFYERFTRDVSIHIPLWLPGTASLEVANGNAALRMAEEACIAPGQLVLDAGCGLGGTALWLAKHHHVTVLGISNSLANIRRCYRLAAERNGGNLTRFLAADLRALPFGANTFDSVWNLESLNYISPKLPYVQSVWRILKPGGTWVCMDRFGDSSAWTSAAGGRSGRQLTEGLYTPRHWESAHTLQAHMQSAGFVNVVYTDFTACVLPAPGRERVSPGGAAAALLATIPHPAALRAMIRAMRIMRASFHLMKAGLMTYGLLAGTKPAG